MPGGWRWTVILNQQIAQIERLASLPSGASLRNTVFRFLEKENDKWLN
jgi:hypothetical protein